MDHKTETDYNELSNRSENFKKRNKLIIPCVIVLVLLFIGLLISFLNNKNSEPINNYNNSDSHENVANDNSMVSSALDFKCALTDESGIKRISELSTYGVGDYLLCNIEITTNFITEIDNMSFKLASKNIDLLNAYDKSNIWQVTVNKNGSSNENIFSISMISNNKTSKDKLADIKFHLYIKDNKTSDTLPQLELRDIKIHKYNDKNDIYTYIKDKEIKYNKDERRYYKKDGSIIFEKMKEDGSFQKKSAYKCISSNYCTINTVSKSFEYKNDNKDIVMIFDGNNWDTSVLYSIENGIIGTYDGSPKWLYTKDSSSKKETYIYVLAKNSDKYGIIDVNGKVMHEFNLGNINANVASGVLDSAYSIENNMIINQKNGKYGISKLTSNDTIIDYIFESVRLAPNNKYFKALLNGKWYLYNFDTKNKAINDGYDNLIIVNNEIIVAEKNKYLYIIDYNGNSLVEDRIEDLSKEYIEYVCCTTNPGISINTNGDIVTVIVYINNDWEKYNQYEYRISTKTLTKIK